MGVAEANMVGVAAGLSAGGKIPFADTFTCFAARRAYDQFFISCNYARLNVKLTGTDPGVAAIYNGGTHMSFEDIGLMRNIPKLTVFEPSDPVSLKQLVKKSAYHPGCTYMRLHRQHIAAIYSEDEVFELGKGKVIKDGTDITLIATGAIMTAEALKAWKILSDEGISAAVIDMHTIKPIDSELVLRYARKTGAVVTCENHQTVNGLGSAVAETLSEHNPALLKRVGVNDEFGEVGAPDYLLEHFGLTAKHIVVHTKKLLDKKK
jgi:transketolase